MESSPPNQGGPGPQERNLTNPLFHHQYAQQLRIDQPPRSFVTGPGFSSVFAPVLPPNLAAMPQLPQQQFPAQQMFPSQNMFGPPQSHLPEEQALRQTTFARAMQNQQQPLKQHHHHPNPLSQQQHLQCLPHHSQSNSQYQSQLPNFGPRLSFTAHPPAHLGLQKASPLPSHNPQNAVSNPVTHLSQFAVQTYRDMHEQSPADFIHGIQRAQSASGSQIFKPQPQPQPQQPARFAIQQPSGIFPPLSPAEMACSRRKKPSRGKNATPSENTKGGTSAQGQLGGTTLQSMARNNSKDATKAENSPEMNPSPLAHIHQRLAGQSGSGPSDRQRNQIGIPGNSRSKGASKTLQPTVAKSPQDETMTGMNEDSGYTSRHEPLGKEVPAPEATAEILDAAAASLEEQIQSAASPLFVEPPAHKFSDFQIAQSVPFMKVTKSIELAVADKVSSLAEDPPFLEGEDRPGRPSYVSHRYNRYITWQQFEQSINRGLDPYFPYVSSPNSFCNYLNTLKDTETLVKLPNGGYDLQYLSEQSQLPDTSIWVVQVTWLPKNGDLWLPAPLIQLLSLFDTPYGIALKCPDSMNTIIRPNRLSEFIECETNTLMEISMERLRTGYLGQPQKSWDLYTAKFMGAHGWTPTVERIRVLDLMFQIDLIYYFQGCGAPLHPFSMYNQNEQRRLEG